MTRFSVPRSRLAGILATLTTPAAPPTWARPAAPCNSSPNRYQRTGDGWKFTERIYEVRYLDSTPLAGSAPRPAGAPAVPPAGTDRSLPPAPPRPAQEAP